MSNFNSDYFMGVVVFCFLAGWGGGGVGAGEGLAESVYYLVNWVDSELCEAKFYYPIFALSKRFYDCFSHTAYSCSLKWTP